MPTKIEIHSIQKNGTYLEAGANDGEFYSVSLYLEVMKGWNGILVEAVPSLYTNLLIKNRRAYSLEGCIGIHDSYYKVYI
jgi:hypothetical protein